MTLYSKTMKSILSDNGKRITYLQASKRIVNLMEKLASLWKKEGEGRSIVCVPAVFSGPTNNLYLYLSKNDSLKTVNIFLDEHVWIHDWLKVIRTPNKVQYSMYWSMIDTKAFGSVRPAFDINIYLTESENCVKNVTKSFEEVKHTEWICKD